MTEVREQAEPQFLRAPSACGDQFENVGWTGTIAVQLDEDLHVGVRFNDAAVQEHVTTALGDRVRPQPDPVPFFSVRLGTPGRRKAAPLHHLYVGARPVLGTRDLGRLLGGLERHLSAQLVPLEGHVAEAVPVRTPRGVLLVPAEILAMAGSVDRLLTPAGFAFADVPRVSLDLGNGTVEVPAPVVDLDADGDRVRTLGPSVAEDRLPAGSHPLAGWLLGVGADQAGSLRRVQGVGHAARTLHTPFPAGAQSTLDGLVALAARVPLTGIAWATHDELVTQVLQAGTDGVPAKR